MGKYINPFTDFGFKKIFGEEVSKKSLISFLNDILPIKDKIKEISFAKNEQLGTNEEKRSAVYDIFCIDEKGTQFIVEMQNAKQVYFKDRAVFYSTFPIQNQAKKGEWNFKLNNVYCIGLLGFEMAESKDVEEEVIVNKEYLHEVKLKNQNNKIFYEKLTFIFVEFPNFDKKESELENHLEKWLYFLKNLDSFESIPEILKEEVFIEAFETAEMAHMNDIERLQYERSLKIFRDNINVINTARIEGFEEGYENGIEAGMKAGIEKGIEKGIEIEKEEIIKKALKEGLDLKIISMITGIDVEKIKIIEGKYIINKNDSNNFS